MKKILSARDGCTFEGAHHTVYSYLIATGYIEDFAEMIGVELIVIDIATKLCEFKKELRYNNPYCELEKGFRG